MRKRRRRCRRVEESIHQEGKMSYPLGSVDLLDREFLDIRASILSLAASFDRIDRAGGSVGDDPRWRRIQEGLNVIRSDDLDRAEQVQLVFSRLYEENWPEQFGIELPQ